MTFADWVQMSSAFYFVGMLWGLLGGILIGVSIRPDSPTSAK